MLIKNPRVNLGVITSKLNKIKLPTITKSVGINSIDSIILFDTEAFNTDINLDVVIDAGDIPIDTDFVDSVIEAECKNCPFYTTYIKTASSNNTLTSNEINYNSVLDDAFLLFKTIKEFITELTWFMTSADLGNKLHPFIQGVGSLNYIINKLTMNVLPIPNGNTIPIYRDIFVSTLKDYKTLILEESKAVDDILVNLNDYLQCTALNKFIYSYNDADLVILKEKQEKVLNILSSILDRYNDTKSRLLTRIDLILEENSTENLLKGNRYTMCLNVYSLSTLNECHKYTEDTMPIHLIDAFNEINNEEGVEDVKITNSISIKVPPLYIRLRLNVPALSIYGYAEINKTSLRLYPFAFPNINSNGLTCLNTDNEELLQQLILEGEFNTILDLFWSSAFNHDLCDSLLYGEKEKEVYDEEYDEEYDDFEEDLEDEDDRYEAYTVPYHKLLVNKLSNLFYIDKEYSNNSLLNTTALTNTMYSSNISNWEWFDLTKHNLYMKVTKLHKVIIVVINKTTDTIEKVIDFYID